MTFELNDVILHVTEIGMDGRHLVMDTYIPYQKFLPHLILILIQAAVLFVPETLSQQGSCKQKMNVVRQSSRPSVQSNSLPEPSAGLPKEMIFHQEAGRATMFRSMCTCPSSNNTSV